MAFTKPSRMEGDGILKFAQQASIQRQLAQLDRSDDADDVGEVIEGTVLRASHVYLLMSNNYRISRNRRAEWFFTHLNTTVTFTPKYKLEEYSGELEIVSIIPKDPPYTWSIEASHLFRYLICSNTIVEVLSRKYRFVYCLDVSPSAGTVDVQTGMVTIDGIFGALENSMKGLVKPFYIPGSYFMFQPKIYVTVIAHAPFLSSYIDEAIVQGGLLDSSTCKHILRVIFRKLEEVENKVAKLTSVASEANAKEPKIKPLLLPHKGNDKADDIIQTSSLAMSSDFGLVDLLRHALIALHLLPENSTSGLILLTDGVISVPDGGYLDIILSQLRYNTVSCSFIQLSSQFHPHASHGALPYADLMRFISTATFGAYLTCLPKFEAESLAMNTYHKCFLTWSFQDSVESFKSSLMAPFLNKPGEWSVQNKCFSTIRDMPVLKKQQYETTMNVDYLKVLSCRLREGFTIKEAQVGNDGMLYIKLILPWKFLIVIEYMLITPWPAPVLQPKVTSVVSLVAPYDFLHDVTCLAKKPLQSYYRQLLVNRFWASQKHLSESDKLLAHFNSFVTNPQYYTIPERLKNGVPLFYISGNSATLTFQPSDSFPHFSQFWKPVCLLDTDIWQKWMHTHRIGVVLEHDHPIPKYIHQPNPSGRYHVIQCRQTMMGLNTLLMDWSSFVLLENHSYIKLIHTEKDKPPNYFCIIRVTTKPPCVILRLAYLVGTPGDLRHRDMSELRKKIASLTFPQRLNEPPKWRVPSGSSFLANASRNYKRTWSDMPCCVIFFKPIEKILIRYEQIPGNFTKSLLPQDPHNNWCLNPNRKLTTNQSTFGFRPTYSTPLGSQIKMGPEMFNTVARYLHHQRWIWSVQGTPTHPLSMECLVRILSTITKMRLQEGMRFAYTSCGIVNLMMEMEIQNERLGIAEPDVENIEDYERSTSVVQYLMFPPVSTLFSNVDEDEEERDDEMAETIEEPSNLFLITECWIEPQLGRILSSTESTSFNGLQYGQVPHKMFHMDRECISALVTFEHLSLMCQDDDVPSPSEVIDRGMGKALEETEDKIHYIPFRCELKRILPKCQQAELLFSMFHQDLSISFPVVKDSEIATFCDRANSILYESLVSNMAQMHKREVLFHMEEHKTLYELITRRVRPLDQGERPFSRRLPEGSYPKWRTFIKGISPTHFLLTILPASYHDLKLLMLSLETLDKTNVNKAVCLLSPDDPNESSCINEGSLLASPTTLQQDSRAEAARCEYEIADIAEVQWTEPSKLKGLESSTTIGIRKRSRVKSGGESGPASKRPLNRKTSLDNLFRGRTNSVEGAWKCKLGKTAIPSSCAKDADDRSYILSPKAGPEQQGSQFCFETPGGTASELTSTLPDKLFPSNHQAKYGSITLPIYVYDCSLSSITEHVIFRTTSGAEDIYTDCRVCSIDEENEAYPPRRSGRTPMPASPAKHVSPEPKSEEHELPPSTGNTLENHCQALEVAFAKSYVHGLFESLQAGHYIHNKDVREAVRLCRETKIELNLSDFIQTICRHFKEIRRRNRSGECSSEEPSYPSCDELKDIHAFIKRRFSLSILSAFHWMMDSPGIFYYKNTNQIKLDEVRSRSISSKNLTDIEEAGSTIKGDSLLTELTTANDVTLTPLENTDPDQDYPILGPDFFTLDESLEVLSEDHEPVPLFLYLACTYVHSEFSGSFLVFDLPTCLEEIAEAFGDGFQEGNPDDKIELFLDFVFLTVPTAVEEIDYRVAGTIRTSSMCSVSQGAPMGKKGELNFIPFARDHDSLSGIFEHGGKVYPTLPSQQYHQVKCVVDEVKWLLKDEVTSFRWESSPMTELALTLVACHVEKSAGKPGCQVTIVPLNFVNNSAQAGFEKFKERYRKSSIDGYEIREQGSLFYLIPIPKPNFENGRGAGRWKSSTLDGLTGPEQLTMSDEMKLSLESPHASSSRIELEMEDPEILEISADREREQQLHKLLRKCAGQESVRTKILASGGIDTVDGGSGEQLKGDVAESTNYLPTPSQFSEISSVVESTNTNEDGYEGDGSDSAEDDTDKLEISIRNRNLPPFWIISKLSVQQVVIYFHSRYDEDNIALFEYLTGLRNRMVRMVRQLKRTVNQDILLQQLHDTRQCSNLIEAKMNSPEYAEHTLHYPPPIVNKRIEDFDIETENEPKQFPSGYFACNVVWETKFILHSRLRTSPGKTLVTTGIKTLQAALIAFEVANRQNMFVYQDSSGNVFYLRLYRMEEQTVDLQAVEADDADRDSKNEIGAIIDPGPSRSNRATLKTTSATTLSERNESVVLLRVHGITQAGDEIKVGLVQSLRNKLDDAVMDNLSITLDRNPHCKLTPEDVTFIQKPNSPPETIGQNRINAFALKHLPAFAYYLHQNLLQFIYLPKYGPGPDIKHELHFRDYQVPSEGEQLGTMYLYNQRPGTGGTGSRGIAAVAVAMVDGNGKSISTAEWSRPAHDAFLAEFGRENFDERIVPEEFGESGQADPPAFVEMRMWKQGRINLDLLKGYLTSAIKHSIWDLTTEFYFLTAPLSAGIWPPNGDTSQFSFSFSAPNTPTRIGSGHEGKMNPGRASSPMAFPFPGQTLNKGRFQQLDPLVVGLSRLETGDVGHLHSLYEKLFPAWCELGAKLSVPSVQLVNIDLITRHPVDTVVLEAEKLVQQILPDYEPKQFWKLKIFGESDGEYEAGERVLADSRLLMRKNTEAELKVLKSNLRQLETASVKTVLKTYPPDLTPLFQATEEFHPKGGADECVLISRNLIHWKFCVGSIDSQFFTPEAYKTQYKFLPLISSAWDQTPVGSYMSLEKLPRPTSATGLACLLDEPENNVNPILIPRQRLMVAKITNAKISFIFYNWSKEITDRLVDNAKLLSSWLNARSCLLSSIHAQKSGLFFNQPLTRGPPLGTSDADPFTGGGADVESLLRYSNPPKEFSRSLNLKKPKSMKNLTPFLECFRNLKHQVTVFTAHNVILDPFKAADEQITQVRCSKKSASKSSIFQSWLQRGPSASNVIGADGIQAFKQAARTIHYCYTPIIFLPRWRNEIACTRDSSIGIERKSRALSDPSPKPLGFHLKADLAGLRSRHDSGTSQKSLDSASGPANKGRSKSIWGLWQNSSSQVSQESQASSNGNRSFTNISSGHGSSKKGDEKWHGALCDSFIQEYMQYLQTLGFIRIQGWNTASKKLTSAHASGNKPEVLETERLRHISGTSLLSTSSSQSGHSMGVTFNNFSRRVREDSGNGEDNVFYLQKSLPGGIILFEVGLAEPFFYAKMHALEVTRIQARKTRKGMAYQNILDFTSQCERMKVLMHLHSFTYDFHLRTIHSYITGRQLLFKQGFHITNFLDDFVKYYPKGPNYARNTVHIGSMTIQNVSTPAPILFSYMLEKLYNMKAIRMTVDWCCENTFILVDLSAKQIVYRDHDDERQCDEFDLTLLIAHDAPPGLSYSGDPSVLRLKYYIILTSRRELYPKSSEEILDGKLYLVDTPHALSRVKERLSRRTDPRSVEHAQGPYEERIIQHESYGDGSGRTGLTGIREEAVHYLSFYSSHEQMMQQIVSEQVDWVEKRIRDFVSTAAVDCRRDLLWQRLVLANAEKQKNQKEDLISRETVGPLTHWDFGELLDLVSAQSLSVIDPSLKCLLNYQPVSFYQCLLKFITQGGSHNYRYFASYDKTVHHLAIFSPNSDISPKVTKHIVMLDINMEKRNADLSILFKEFWNPESGYYLKHNDFPPDLVNLINSVVNTVCYCWWWWSTVCPST